MDVLLNAREIVRDAVRNTRVPGIRNTGVLGSGPLKVSLETNGGHIVPNILLWDDMADQARNAGIGANVRLFDGMNNWIAGKITSIT